MGAFADLRDRVGDALDTVCVANPDWSVLRLPVDSLAPPAYMLGWSDPWVSGQATFCRYDVALDVRCIAARIEPDPGIELLEEMIEAAAVALDQARLPVRFVLPPRPFPIGGVTYQAALLTVTATVQLTAPAAPVGGVSGAAHLTALALLTAAGTVIAAVTVDGAVELDAVAALTAGGHRRRGRHRRRCGHHDRRRGPHRGGHRDRRRRGRRPICPASSAGTTPTTSQPSPRPPGRSPSGVTSRLARTTSPRRPVHGNRRPVNTIGGRNALDVHRPDVAHRRRLPVPDRLAVLRHRCLPRRRGGHGGRRRHDRDGVARPHIAADAGANAAATRCGAPRAGRADSRTPTGTPYQPAVQYDAGAQTVTTFRGGVADGTPVAGVTYTGAAGLVIGAGSGAVLTGTIGELVIVDGVVSPADRAALAAYFSAKWTAAP